MQEGTPRPAAVRRLPPAEQRSWTGGLGLAAVRLPGVRVVAVTEARASRARVLVGVADRLRRRQQKHVLGRS